MDGGAGAAPTTGGARPAGGENEAGAGGGRTSSGASSTGGSTPAAGGEAGAPGECVPLETRSCQESGALGDCAAGQQQCTAQGIWGPCSITPAASDTCESGNDANCNGVLNEGCPCVKGETRSCADGGFVGKCATGTQTCTDKGAWGACSIAPAVDDTCEPGNNDNCSGPPNEGCACVLGTTRACGACLDGTQTCTNGKTGQYSACSGAVLTPTTWYRDADGDGYGSAVTTTVCSTTKPPGYTDRTGDCCDDGENLTIAAQIHPGQMEWFQSAANICGITWDYDCSSHHELRHPEVGDGCIDNATPPNNCESKSLTLTDATCGTLISTRFCSAVVQSQGSSYCQAAGTGFTQGCH